ncbi:hypothetical protein QN372_00275 [Undibacterium sp. RTI2.1]|uniref:hypothetical protein n=1 Tax=unclassified Undibacterium TaxID=2630295 RepID=UPI002B238BB9|nr:MULTISPECIES: hypothetical protein [unclassified Undibacterium]MEB0029174.1 hypothetical protein [Undibacterium sp. RTI2.1]MEB0115482.1 hypothetical protein [Undibacterium sp. RTI2.2]
MANPAEKNSRREKPIEDVVEYGEDTFTCHHCNSAIGTECLFTDGSWRGRCCHCGQTYDITTELEDIGEDDEPVLRDASQSEIERLFGIKPSPYGKDFGSF